MQKSYEIGLHILMLLIFPCYLDRFFIPKPTYARPDENRVLQFSYYEYDLRKGTSKLIPFNYPSDQLSSLDSINPVLQRITKEAEKENRFITIQIKFENLCFPDFCKILCLSKAKQLPKMWDIDLRYNELLLYCNFEGAKTISEERFLENYHEDWDALKEVDDIRNVQFYFTASRDNDTKDSLNIFKGSTRFLMFDYRQQFADLEHYDWVDNDFPLKDIEQIMIKINERYDKNKSDDETYNYYHRLGFQLQIGSNISMLNVLKVISLARDNKMIYNLNNAANSLVFYVTCPQDNINEFY